MIRRPPRSTQSRSSAASDVYKRQAQQRAWRVPLKLSPEEITSVLRSQIEEYEAEVDVEEVGIVLEVGDGIARIHGLRNAVSLEMLELPHDVMGLVLNLEENNVGVVLLGEDTLIKEGDLVKQTGKVIRVPVGTRMTFPVRLTRSPSLINVSSPSKTTPTLFSSRLSTSPMTSCGSSSISRDTALRSP